MNQKAEDLKARTHRFLMDVVEFCRTVEPSIAGRSFSEQLVDAAGGADSNYGACCKARSRKEFIAKVGTAAEEADESKRWLEALRDARLGDKTRVGPLIKEANELAAIFTASGRTASINEAQQRQRRQEEKRAKGRSRRRG